MVEDKFPRFLWDRIDFNRILFKFHLFHLLFFRILGCYYFLFLIFLFLFHNSITFLNFYPVQSLYLCIFFKIGNFTVCCNIVKFINWFFLYIILFSLYLLSSINNLTYKNYNIIWNCFSKLFNLLLFPGYIVCVVRKDVFFHFYSVYLFVEGWVFVWC